MQSQEDIANNPADGLADRKSDRDDVMIVASIRAFGSVKCQAKIIDISTAGFRMECLTHLSNSQPIFLTIPSFQQLEARIVWRTEWIYGCEFVRPLYAAVYDHIVRTHPSIAKPLSTADASSIGTPVYLPRDLRRRG